MDFACFLSAVSCKSAYRVKWVGCSEQFILKTAHLLKGSLMELGDECEDFSNKRVCCWWL